jgi:hypothetical protein
LAILSNSIIKRRGRGERGEDKASDQKSLPKAL